VGAPVRVSVAGRTPPRPDAPTPAPRSRTRSPETRTCSTHPPS